MNAEQEKPSMEERTTLIFALVRHTRVLAEIAVDPRNKPYERELSIFDRLIKAIK